ncbi:hypothetical protein BGZ63DRAFT_402213 [Mariannaea sp. PMI_226]|nr:hypothetical protein BGZ63DRAFT_402213 [Mariannaea sp. PMI_226]
MAKMPDNPSQTVRPLGRPLGRSLLRKVKSFVLETRERFRFRRHATPASRQTSPRALQVLPSGPWSTVGESGGDASPIPVREEVAALRHPHLAAGSVPPATGELRVGCLPEDKAPSPSPSTRGGAASPSSSRRDDNFPSSSKQGTSPPITSKSENVGLSTIESSFIPMPQAPQPVAIRPITLIQRAGMEDQRAHQHRPFKDQSQVNHITSPTMQHHVSSSDSFCHTKSHAQHTRNPTAPSVAGTAAHGQTAGAQRLSEQPRVGCRHVGHQSVILPASRHDSRPRAIPALPSRALSMAMTTSSETSLLPHRPEYGRFQHRQTLLHLQPPASSHDLRRLRTPPPLRPRCPPAPSRRPDVFRGHPNPLRMHPISAGNGAPPLIYSTRAAERDSLVSLSSFNRRSIHLRDESHQSSGHNRAGFRGSRSMGCQQDFCLSADLEVNEPAFAVSGKDKSKDAES